MKGSVLPSGSCLCTEPCTRFRIHVLRIRVLRIRVLRIRVLRIRVLRIRVYAYTRITYTRIRTRFRIAFYNLYSLSGMF